MDSFLLKLNGGSKSGSFSDTRPVNRVVAAPVSDAKSVKEYGCHGCELIWRQPSDEAVAHEITFFNNKQYDGMQIGGLVRPIDVLVSFVSAPEMVFREHVTNTVHNPNIRLRYVESVEKRQEIVLVACGDSDTHCHKSHMYYTAYVFHCKNSPSS